MKAKKYQFNEKSNEDYANEYVKRVITNRPKVTKATEEIIRQYIPNNSVILDIGSGPGILAHLIENIKKGCTIIGVEIDATFHQANEKIAKNMQKNTFVPILGDISKIEYFDRAIDILYLSRSLHEIANDMDLQKKILVSLVQKLSVNGRIIIIDPYYIEKVSENPEKYKREIDSARKSLNQILGHSHSLREIPPPAIIQKELNEIMHIDKMMTFDDELTDWTGIVKSYCIIGSPNSK